MSKVRVKIKVGDVHKRTDGYQFYFGNIEYFNPTEKFEFESEGTFVSMAVMSALRKIERIHYDSISIETVEV